MYVAVWLNILLAELIAYFVMPLTLDYVGLLSVWSFLGANHITRDIQLALQTHAVERQFNNWFLHVLLHDELREFFESVHFHNFPAHPRVTRRLQGALDLLVLRCANHYTRKLCTVALETSGVVLHEFVCASRSVLSLDHNISNLPRYVLGVGAFDNIRIFYHRVRTALEERHEHCDGSLYLLEITLARLCSKDAALWSKKMYDWCWTTNLLRQWNVPTGVGRMHRRLFVRTSWVLWLSMSYSNSTVIVNVHQPHICQPKHWASR